MHLPLSLPPELDKRCFEFFLQCDEFENERILGAVFVTHELQPFKNELPKSAGNKKNFVIEVKAWLLKNRLADGRPLLLPLLAALHYDPSDARYVERQAVYQAVQNLVARAAPKTTSLPADLLDDLYSPNLRTREGAINELGRLLPAPAARAKLEELHADDTLPVRLHSIVQKILSAADVFSTPTISSASRPLRSPQIEPVLTLKVSTPPHYLLFETPFPLEVSHIPAGEFLMGSDKQKDKDAQDNELPQHRIYVSEFYIGRYPITNAQYAVFAKAQRLKWEMPQGKEHHPVVNVSWNEAVAFCQWLSKQTKQNFRLPTEAEWEKAARGPSTSSGHIYPWGDVWEPNKANADEQFKDTTPVGKFSPVGDSEYGVSDMSGNVWEWCADWWARDEYQNLKGQVVRDPTGPSTGRYRIVRGGAFSIAASSVRCAYRFVGDPFDRYRNYGFRVVASGV